MKIYKIAFPKDKFWQAPDGTIIFVDKHSSWDYDGKHYQYGRDNIDGWNRGLISGGKILVNYPSSQQVRELKDLSISIGYPVVYYDTSNREKEFYNPIL